MRLFSFSFCLSRFFLSFSKLLLIFLTAFLSFSGLTFVSGTTSVLRFAMGTVFLLKNGI